MAALGETNIAGSMIKVEELVNTQKVYLNAGAKKILVPIAPAAYLEGVPPELMGGFQIIYYQSTKDAVIKAFGME